MNKKIKKKIGGPAPDFFICVELSYQTFTLKEVESVYPLGHYNMSYPTLRL